MICLELESVNDESEVFATPVDNWISDDSR